MDILHLEFMQNALMAGLLASIICGVVGSLVVVNRVVFLAGGIAHASYGGVGLAFILGLPVLPVTMVFAVGASLIMAAVTLRIRERADTIIGVLWASGMALGIILLDLTPGYNVDLMSYLFGSILAVSRTDVMLMAGLSAVVLTVTLAFFRGFLIMSFDEEFARARGVPVDFLHYLLMAMVGLSVVMIIRVVGLILVIALLSIPPFMAERTTSSLKGMMAVSTGLSVCFTLTGLWVAYLANISSGAAIIGVASVCFFLFLLGDKLRRRA